MQFGTHLAAEEKLHIQNTAIQKMIFLWCIMNIDSKDTQITHFDDTKAFVLELT